MQATVSASEVSRGSSPEASRGSRLWRLTILVHRYLGIGLGILVFLWCTSGIIMMYDADLAVGVDYLPLSSVAFGSLGFTHHLAPLIRRSI